MIRFDHVNIRVSDQEAVRDFLVAVIGVKEGPRPPFDFHGYWLYLGDLPVIHLAPRDRAGRGRLGQSHRLLRLRLRQEDRGAEGRRFRPSRLRRCPTATSARSS